MGSLEQGAKSGKFGYGSKTPWKISEDKAKKILGQIGAGREFGGGMTQIRGADIKKVNSIISGGSSPKPAASPAIKKPFLPGQTAKPTPSIKPLGGNPFIKR